jgi:hypothetical protein
MTQIDNAITVILEKFPFLSYGSFCDDHYLGIIQNADNQLVSLYDLNAMPQEVRNRFLVMGEQWWWESNRQIPIHIFLKERFRIFRPYLKHFSRKEFELKAGPSVSLQETIARRVRKRQITLLRKID